MTQTNSTLVNHSRYVSGGQTEVNSKRLEWWERATFSFSESDDTYVVDSKTAGRIDLIAASFLGDSHLWWLIAQYNSILDVFDEISVGRILRIPNTSRVQQMLGGKLGGYESKREVPLTNISPIV